MSLHRKPNREDWLDLVALGIRLGAITLAGAIVLGLAIGVLCSVVALPFALLGRWFGWW